MRSYNDETDLLIHVDVCPECGETAYNHMLDAPGFCKHEYERYVPVAFIAYDWRSQPDPDR